MNRRRYRRGMAIAVGLLTLGGLGWGETALKANSFLRIEGDSTLHKWTSSTGDVRLQFQPADIAPAALAEAIQSAKVKGLEVHVPVAGLRSGESGLDKNMRSAMKASQFPDVVYRLGRYELAKGSGPSSWTAKTSGELTIAGRTRPADMDVELSAGADALELKGLYTLKMSDFGIKPPTLMFGAIKVRDQIAIRFDLFLKTSDKTEKENNTK